MKPLTKFTLLLGNCRQYRQGRGYPVMGYHDGYGGSLVLLPRQQTGMETGCHHSAAVSSFPSQGPCPQGYGRRKTGLPDRETGLGYGQSGRAMIHSGNPGVNSVLGKVRKSGNLIKVMQNDHDCFPSQKNTGQNRKSFNKIAPGINPVSPETRNEGSG